MKTRTQQLLAEAEQKSAIQVEDAYYQARDLRKSMAAKQKAIDALRSELDGIIKDHR